MRLSLQQHKAQRSKIKGEPMKFERFKSLQLRGPIKKKHKTICDNIPSYLSNKSQKRLHLNPLCVMFLHSTASRSFTLLIKRLSNNILKKKTNDLEMCDFYDFVNIYVLPLYWLNIRVIMWHKKYIAWKCKNMICDHSRALDCTFMS